MALERPGVPEGKKGMTLGEREAGPLPLEAEEGSVAGGAGAAAGGLRGEGGGWGERSVSVPEVVHSPQL